MAPSQHVQAAKPFAVPLLLDQGIQNAIAQTAATATALSRRPAIPNAIDVRAADMPRALRRRPLLPEACHA